MRANWASSSTHAGEGCLPPRRRMAVLRSNYITTPPPSCDGAEFGPALLVWGPCPARMVDRRKMAANCNCWFGRTQCRSHHLDSPPARAWGPADTRCSPQAHLITAAEDVSREGRPREPARPLCRRGRLLLLWSVRWGRMGRDIVAAGPS